MRSLLFLLLLFVFCLAFVIAGIWFASLYSSLDVQNNDDYVWYLALLHMYEATKGQAPLSMLVPNAYYGLPFWLISFFSAWPFFAVHSEAGALIAPRVIEIVFAAASLAVIVVGLQKELMRRLPTANPLWLLLAMPVILVMPIWWTMAQLNHPQHMLVCAELCAITFLVFDSGKLGKKYWWAVTSVCLGFALKVEAVMLAPVFIVYLLLAAYLHPGIRKKVLRVGMLSVVFVFVVWILLNPYLLTPAGFNIWLRTSGNGVFYVFTNGTRNVVEHRDAPTVSIVRQFSMLSKNFYPAPTIGLLIFILVADAVNNIRRRKFAASVFLAPYSLLSLAICLVVANTSPYYWMTAMAALLYAAVPVLVWGSGRYVVPYAIAAVLLLQAMTVGSATAKLLSDRANSLLYSSMLERFLPVSEIRKVSDAQANEVRQYLKGADRIVISPNSNINFVSLGIPYLEQFYGCLTLSSLSASGARMKMPEVDTVILRKNDPTLQGACPETVALTKEWQDNPNSSFRLVKTTRYLMVFRSAKLPAVPN